MISTFKSIAFLTAVGVAAGVAAGGSSATPADTGSRAPAFGFVDVQRVIFEYDKTAEITRALEKRIDEERQLLRQKEEALRSKLEELEMESLRTVPESEQKSENAALLEQIRRRKEIELERVDIELTKKHALIQHEQDLVEHMKKVYQEILRQAEAVARDRDLKAVFMVARPEIQGTSRQEVNSEILVRPVLWHDGGLDLTTEIIQRLNG